MGSYQYAKGVMKLTDFPDCDNVMMVHVPVICGENGDAYAIFCRQCGNEWRVGRDHRGAPNKEEWGDLFFEDAVQPPHPIFYKLHAERMSTV